MRKLTSLIMLLLMLVGVGMNAQTTVTAKYGKGNGTFYNAAGNATSSGFDAKTFVSNTTPAATVTCSYDTGLNSGDAADGARLGANAGDNVYTISVPDGYIITGYTFDCQAVNASHPAKTLTTEDGTEYNVSAKTYQNVNVTGVNKQSTYFTITTTGWSPINTKNFKIFIEEKTRYNIVYNCYDTSDSFIESVTSEEKYDDGATVDVSGFTHVIPGYVQQSIDPTSVTINGANAEVKVVYAPAASYDYTVAINATNPFGTVMTTDAVPAGTVVTIKGNVVADGDAVSYGEAVEVSDVSVAFPTGYEYMVSSVTISGGDITVDCYDPRWPINFSKDQKYIRTDRFIQNVRIGSKTFTITNDGLNTPAYRDCTSDVLVVPAGATLVPAIGYTGAWMHGFFYVDLDNDGTFYVENPGHTTAANTEYNGELLSYANQGDALNSSHQEMPAFVMPTTPGDYRARFKMDWSSTDPGGNPGADINDVNSSNHIIANGGTIVDITLRILDPCDLLPDEIVAATDLYNSVKDHAGELGYQTVAVVDALKQAIDDAEAAGGVDCATHIANLNTATEAVNDKANRVMPQANTFLRFKASALKIASQPYLRGEHSTVSGKEGRLAYSTEATANSIWYFDGTNLYNYDGGFAFINNSGQADVATSASATATTVAFEPSAKGELGACNIKFNDSRYLYAQEDLYADAGSDANGNGYSFNIEEVTEFPVALTKCNTYLYGDPDPDNHADEYYTTLYMPVKVKVTGAEVYTIKASGTENSFDMVLVDDGVVPAEKGVILKNATGTATATVCDDASSLTSLLTGTVPATAYNANAYVLSVANQKLGLYKLAADVEMKGFRAYYVPTSGNADPTRGFVLNFGETTTGVSSAVLNGSDKAYDLQGRRVNNAQKGVYIINGKKVVK